MWRGGSMARTMSRIIAREASSRSSSTTPPSDAENTCGWRATCTTSAWRSTAQYAVPSGIACRYTGWSRRKRSSVSCGGPSTYPSGSYRSIVVVLTSRSGEVGRALLEEGARAFLGVVGAHHFHAELLLSFEGVLFPQGLRGQHRGLDVAHRQGTVGGDAVRELTRLRERLAVGNDVADEPHLVRPSPGDGIAHEEHVHRHR